MIDDSEIWLRVFCALMPETWKTTHEPAVLSAAKAADVALAEYRKRFPVPVDEPPPGLRRPEPLNRPAPAPPVEESPVGDPPDCPDCDAGPMRLRRRRDAVTGGRFWGCRAYPDCKGIVSIDPPPWANGGSAATRVTAYESYDYPPDDFGDDDIPF